MARPVRTMAVFSSGVSFFAMYDPGKTAHTFKKVSEENV